MSRCCWLLAAATARWAAQPVGASTWRRVEGVGVEIWSRTLSVGELRGGSCGPRNARRRNFGGPVRQGPASSAASGVCALRLQIFFRQTPAPAPAADSPVYGEQRFCDTKTHDRFQASSTTPACRAAPIAIAARRTAAMAGKGMKSLSEAMRSLSLAAQPCRAMPVRLLFEVVLWFVWLTIGCLHQVRQVPMACRRSMATAVETKPANITRSVTEAWNPSTRTAFLSHLLTITDRRSQ
jgi:hypothetical protein